MAGLDAWACVQPLPGRTGQLTCALLRAGAGVLCTPGGGAHPAVGTLFGRAERQRQATPNGGDRAHLLTWPPSTIPSEWRPGSLPPPPHTCLSLREGSQGSLSVRSGFRTKAKQQRDLPQDTGMSGT